MSVEMMNQATVLITAGGTLEPIDGVRQIKNTSSGKLGASIANDLKRTYPNIRIIYMSNRFTVQPKIDCEWIETKSVLDVQEKMKEILTTRKIDIVVHSMAIADYTVSGIESNGAFYSTEELQVSKLSSDAEEMKIVLKKAPKIISQIKEWQPHVYLVGFKLLNNVTEEHLYDVAFNALRKNRSNLVIANDLSLIKEGNHTGLFVYPEKQYDVVEGKQNIAAFLTETLTKRAFVKRTKAIELSKKSHIPNHVLNRMKVIGERIFEDGLLPVVEGGTYGNMSLKFDNQFFITGRNVHKGQLTKDILCRIEKVDEVNEPTKFADIYYHGKVKPSIDTAIHHMIYQKYPSLEAILHLHTNKLFHAGLTVDSYVCGSQEEGLAIVNKMTDTSQFVQMKKHGVIIGDKCLTNCYEQWKNRLNEIHLTPILETEHHTVWEEWKQHLKDIDAQFSLDKKDYYVIQKGQDLLGLVYVKEDKHHVEFAMYTLSPYHGKKLNIGQSVLNILQSFNKDLLLITKNECGVVDYYKKKGFHLSKIENNMIFMLKQ